MQTFSLILIMFVAVLFSSIIVRVLPSWLQIPVPLIQIALGASISMVAEWRLELDPQVFFLLFLPPLLFLDGWRIPKEGLFRDRGIILSLAIGLVVFTVIGAGYFIHWLIPTIPLGVAFALAAVISPTDPVAVSAIASRIPIPKRLMHILEGESLLNDASGLVCLRFAIASVLTGSFVLSDAIVDFLRLSLGGIAIGVSITLIITKAKVWVSKRYGEEVSAQILISLLLPFIVYLAAEHLHCSGILAAVASGITMGYSELSGQAMALTRVRRTAVWDMLQFALNGLMFVLLGEQLPGIVANLSEILGEAGQPQDDGFWLLLLYYVLVINLALGALRFIWVFISLRFTIFTGKDADNFKIGNAVHIAAATSVAGVRGAISLAGVLTLPLLVSAGYPFPARDLVVFLAAGVIIVSLIVASIGVPLLVRGLFIPSEPEEEQSEDLARNKSAEAAIRAIEHAQYKMSETTTDASLYIEAAARVTDVYRNRINSQLAPIDGPMTPRALEEIEQQLRLTGLRAERAELFRMARTKELDEQLARKLIRKIDLMEAQIIR